MYSGNVLLKFVYSPNTTYFKSRDTLYLIHTYNVIASLDLSDVLFVLIIKIELFAHSL